MLDSPEKIHDALMKEYSTISETQINQAKEKFRQEFEAMIERGEHFNEWERLFRDVSIMIETSIDAALLSVAYVIHRRATSGK